MPHYTILILIEKHDSLNEVYCIYFSPFYTRKEQTDQDLKILAQGCFASES